ncbi:glycosyltransferase family 4 protein [Micromonospora sp. NPDC050187]|uniref:glycosyltransferase family 4 protein n=1 Tax=Micromonospora sp. NPDC050187 TaxID=3364277 RepID=UPI003796E560
MTHSAPGQAVVKFVEDVDDSARAQLTSRLEHLGLSARTGLDLGDRGPRWERFAPVAVVTLLDDLTAAGTEVVAGVTRIVRDWLVATAESGFVEVELRATDQVVRVRARDPETAVRLLAAALPTATTGPVGWTGNGWGPEPEEAAAGPTGSSSPRVLTLDTHWFSAKGGLSTFNRALCAALVRAGADVVCVVLRPAPEETAHARAVGVTLVAAPPAAADSAARDALLRRPPLPDGWEPDLVVGHGRITGMHARILVEDHFRSAARAHVVHTWSDHIEWQRGDRSDSGAIAERRWKEDIELARTATRAFGVGPLLHGLLERDLSVHPDVAAPGRIDPGFDLDDDTPRTPPRWHQRQVMLSGRLDDWQVKGLDLAARAVGAAVELLSPGGTEIELLLRGVPPTEHGRLRETVLRWADRPGLQVTPRTYSTDTADVRDDLRRASLVLMPSRAEGFGLVGLEAVVAGTPLLVSAKSGLGMLLREVLPPDDAALAVLPIDTDDGATTRLWAAHTTRVLRDPSGAFAAAERIRRAMAGRVTNADAAAAVLGTLS